MKSLIIGSCCLDVIMNVDNLPDKEGDVNARSLSVSMGGMAYNVYQILSLFEEDAILACPIGTGRFASMMEDFFKEKGLPVFYRDKNEDNGICLCFVDEKGERSFLSYHGAEYRFHKDSFDDIDFSQIDYIYISGLEVEERDGDDLVAFLEEKKKQIFFDPGVRISNIPQDRMKKIFSLHPYLHLNEKEAIEYSGTNSPIEAGKYLFDQTKAPVIITTGEKGAYLFTEKENILIEGRKTETIDTIGAGDSHTGAIIMGLKKGLSLKEAVLKANIISSYVVSSKGAGLKEEDHQKVKDLY